MRASIARYGPDRWGAERSIAKSSRTGEFIRVSRTRGADRWLRLPSLASWSFPTLRRAERPTATRGLSLSKPPGLLPLISSGTGGHLPRGVNSSGGNFALTTSHPTSISNSPWHCRYSTADRCSCKSVHCICYSSWRC